MVVWTHSPSLCLGALVRFFPKHIGLIIRFSDSACEISLQCNFYRACLSRMQSFLYVQTSILARPPDCTYQMDFSIGSQALYTTQCSDCYLSELWYRYVTESDNCHGWTLTSWIAALSAATKPPVRLKSDISH